MRNKLPRTLLILMSRRQKGLTQNQLQRPRVKTLDMHTLTSNSPDPHLQHRVFSTIQQIDFVVRSTNSWRHVNHVHFWRKERDEKLRHWMVGDPKQACQYNECDGRLTLKDIVQELCESRDRHPGLSVLTSLLVSVDVKIYWTMLRHWSLVPNMSTDIWGH